MLLVGVPVKTPATATVTLSPPAATDIGSKRPSKSVSLLPTLNIVKDTVLIEKGTKKSMISDQTGRMWLFCV